MSKNQAADLQQLKRWPNWSPAGASQNRGGGKGMCPGERLQSESGFTTCVCVRGQRTSLPCSSDASFYKNQTCEYIPHGDIGRVWHTLRARKTPEIEIPQKC